MQKKRILLAGGGTGGHVFPIQNIIKHLDKNHSKQIEKLYRLGSPNSLEEKTFHSLDLKQTLVEFIPLTGGKFRRETRFVSLLKNIRDLFLFAMAIFQSCWVLYKIRPDIIFCKGGFVALPIVITAPLFRIPIVVHESDTKPGLTNRIAYYLSHKAFSAFPGVFPQEEVVGQILSDDLEGFQKIEKGFRGLKKISEDGKQDSGNSSFEHLSNSSFKHFDIGAFQHLTICLIIGGSQGSRKLYSDIGSILSYNKKLLKNYFFLVVGGHQDVDFSSLFPKSDHICYTGFVDAKTMAYLLYISDISITRGGSTSLAEQQLFNIKKIIVPIPRTHDQLHNGQYYADKYQDILIDSKKPGFEETLDLTLQQYVGYKKDKISTQNFTYISQVKNRISESFFIS